ncbi:hypothetical protein AVEN_242835-1 [Araneus ventricosus]|uniref:BTB domain-containing protein n=1 Tax=Araneus ventricosus TaxID=182803 RepID=A0A4Y2K0F6_ARAVE|nr:hypothetical protein AVEN_242835-1 [Araneus ventricosus]
MSPLTLKKSRASKGSVSKGSPDRRRQERMCSGDALATPHFAQTGKTLLPWLKEQLLSVSKLGPERKFAGVMREGSSSLEINFEYQFGEVFSSGINYSLEGDMNIISISEICVSAFGNKEYIKGDNLKSLEQLSNDFESLLNPQTSFLSDVNLICGGVSIPAHKNIFCARSHIYKPYPDRTEEGNQSISLATRSSDVVFSSRR